MKSILTLIFMIASFSVFGDSLSDVNLLDQPIPPGANNDFDFDYAMNVYDALKAGSWAAGLAALTQLLKTRLFFQILHRINKKLWPQLVILLGAISGTVENISNGLPWYLGFFKGGVVGMTAAGMYDMVTKNKEVIKNKEPIVLKEPQA